MGSGSRIGIVSGVFARELRHDRLGHEVWPPRETARHHELALHQVVTIGPICCPATRTLREALVRSGYRVDVAQLDWRKDPHDHTDRLRSWLTSDPPMVGVVAIGTGGWSVAGALQGGFEVPRVVWVGVPWGPCTELAELAAGRHPLVEMLCERGDREELEHALRSWPVLTHDSGPPPSGSRSLSVGGTGWWTPGTGGRAVRGDGRAPDAEVDVRVTSAHGDLAGHPRTIDAIVDLFEDGPGLDPAGDSGDAKLLGGWALEGDRLVVSPSDAIPEDELLLQVALASAPTGAARRRLRVALVCGPPSSARHALAVCFDPGRLCRTSRAVDDLVDGDLGRQTQAAGFLESGGRTVLWWPSSATVSAKQVVVDALRQLTFEAPWDGTGGIAFVVPDDAGLEWVVAVLEAVLVTRCGVTVVELLSESRWTARRIRDELAHRSARFDVSATTHETPATWPEFPSRAASRWCRVRLEAVGDRVVARALEADSHTEVCVSLKLPEEWSVLAEVFRRKPNQRSTHAPGMAALSAAMLALCGRVPLDGPIALQIDESLEWVPWELVWPASQSMRGAVAAGLPRQRIRARAERRPVATDDVLVVLGPNVSHGERHLGAVRMAFPDARAVEDPHAVRTEVDSFQGRVLHVVGHGNAAHGVAIGFHDHVPSSLLTAKHVLSDRSAPRLVFLAACDQARPVPDAFARELLDVGVRAVVAAAWSVDRLVIEQFAIGFYGAVSKGCTFGDAVLAGRRMADRVATDDSWAAIRCWGDPDMRLSTIEGSGPLPVDPSAEQVGFWLGVVRSEAWRQPGPGVPEDLRTLPEWVRRSPDLAIEAARAALDRGDPELALSLMEAAGRHDETWADAAVEVAVRKFAGGEPRRALALLRQARDRTGAGRPLSRSGVLAEMAAASFSIVDARLRPEDARRLARRIQRPLHEIEEISWGEPTGPWIVACRRLLGLTGEERASLRPAQRAMTCAGLERRDAWLEPLFGALRSAADEPVRCVDDLVQALRSRWAVPNVLEAGTSVIVRTADKWQPVIAADASVRTVVALLHDGTVRAPEGAIEEITVVEPRWTPLAELARAIENAALYDCVASGRTPRVALLAATEDALTVSRLRSALARLRIDVRLAPWLPSDSGLSPMAASMVRSTDALVVLGSRRLDALGGVADLVAIARSSFVGVLCVVWPKLDGPRPRGLAGVEVDQWLELDLLEVDGDGDSIRAEATWRIARAALRSIEEAASARLRGLRRLVDLAERTGEDIDLRAHPPSAADLVEGKHSLLYFESEPWSPRAVRDRRAAHAPIWIPLGLDLSMEPGDPKTRSDRPTLMLMAGVPERRPHVSADVDEPYLAKARPAAVRYALTWLCRMAFGEGFGLVFGGHPRVVTVVLQCARDLRMTPDRLRLFQARGFEGLLHPDMRRMMASGRADVVWVGAPDDDPEAATLALREAMIGAGADGAVVIGGMSNVVAEAVAFRQAFPQAPVLAVPETGSAAEVLARGDDIGLGWVTSEGEDTMAALHRFLSALSAGS